MKAKITLIRANKTKFGGAENYLTRLSEALNDTDITTRTIHSPFSKILPSWLRALLFNYWICQRKKDNFYFSLERITCADIYRAGDGVHRVFLTKVSKSKLNPLHIVYKYLERKCFENSLHIIANSHMVKNDIISTYAISPAKISVIYSGIVLHATTNTSDIKKEFAIKDEHILLYVGSGFKRKGVKEFLQLVSALRTFNIKAFVVGGEKRLYYYQALAKELGIEDIVIFTGSRIDVAEFYALSDIFILPTYYEPFSNVVLEAMAEHNAVFTTKDNGASEILDTQYVMDTPSADISEQIDDLLSNPQKLAEVKERNYKVVQDFSIEKNARQTLELLNTFLDKKQQV